MKQSKGILVIISAALLLAVFALQVAAQKKVIREERRISLRLKKADVSKILPQFADMMDAKLDLQCDRKATVTIDFSNLKIETALTAICESSNLEWKLTKSPSRVLVVTCAPDLPPPPKGKAQEMEVRVKKQLDDKSGKEESTNLTLELKEANFEEVIKMVARLDGAKLLLDQSLADKSVTCTIKNKPLKEMLDIICDKVGAKWVLKDGNPPILKVSKK